MKRSQIQRTRFKRRIRLDADHPTLPNLLRKRRSARTVLKAGKPLKRKHRIGRTKMETKWLRDGYGVFVKKPGARVEKNCPICGVAFMAWVNRPRPTKTCSRVCMGKLRQQEHREDRICRECGCAFTVQLGHLRQDPRRGRYCSVVCRNTGKVKDHESRPLNPRYKNEAHLKGDKDWKRAVREKDGYTCQRCGKYDPYIHAHHVNPRSQRPDLIRDVANGKCLCASCHAWVHRHPIAAKSLGLLGGTTYEKAAKERAAA